MSLADLRQSYEKSVLLENKILPSPFAQFTCWFDEAVQANVPEPHAMTLATVNTQGWPSARIVLMKGFDQQGFVFYTNYASRKGRDLDSNDHVCLLFFWQQLERQVRIEGRAQKISAAESDAYYHSRPLESRIGAWASRQSQPVTRPELEARVVAFQTRYGDHPPRPPHWGGYRVAPEAMEFWQGRPSRLHDRLIYRRDSAQGWAIQRLAP